MPLDRGELLDLAVDIVREEFLANAITRDAAAGRLRVLELDDVRAELLLARWELEKGRPTRRLTPAQVLNAWSAGIFNDGQVRDELAAQGYNSRDAEVLILVEAS
jgi:hypothetical protein